MVLYGIPYYMLEKTLLLGCVGDNNTSKSLVGEMKVSESTTLILS